jgi:hypothetical protein
MPAPTRTIDGFLFPRNAVSVAATADRLRLVWAARSAIARTGRMPPSILFRLFGRECDANALRTILEASAGAPMDYRQCIREGYVVTVASAEAFDAITVALDLTDDATERRALEYARTTCARALPTVKAARQ